MRVNRVLAALPVADVDAAVGWYERLFGRPPDARPMDGLVEWHFPPTAVVQIVDDADRAGRSELSLQLDDLERELAGLRERGLDPGPLDDTTSDKVLLSGAIDPEGNTINLIEAR